MAFMNDNSALFLDNLPNSDTVITAEIVENESQSTDGTDWVTLSCQLRQQNQDLQAQIRQREQALAEMRSQLQNQNRRLQSCDTLIQQQNEELQYEKHQLQRALAEIECYRQAEQHQPILIANLTAELTRTRQQLARLERECALTQESYQEKSQKLLNAEQQLQELLARLQRQQRYTLQYKAALEQYLSQPSDRTSGNDLAIVARVSTIEPWSQSTENDEIDPIDEFLAEFEKTEPVEAINPKSADWPSPLISTLPKYPSFRVDLPTFLKYRQEKNQDENNL
jgi:chromosome segregation ATPase